MNGKILVARLFQRGYVLGVLYLTFELFGDRISFNETLSQKACLHNKPEFVLRMELTEPLLRDSQSNCRGKPHSKRDRTGCGNRQQTDLDVHTETGTAPAYRSRGANHGREAAVPKWAVMDPRSAIPVLVSVHLRQRGTVRAAGKRRL